MRLRMRKKKAAAALVIILALVCLIIVGISLYGKRQMSRLSELSFEEALSYTTGGQEGAAITVGVLKDGEASYTVYGENGAILEPRTYTYEIGSLTKTFTAALVEKAMEEGRIKPEDRIDVYLSLPPGKLYPTVEELLTHTSGYKAYYLEMPMIGNHLSGKNDFRGITGEMLLKRIESVAPADTADEDRDYAFCYSNFGFAVLGQVLEAVYQEDYTTLMNRYLQEELYLSGTRISDGKGDLDNYWDWEEQDAYLPAGGILSNIGDMLAYAKLLLEDEGLKRCQSSLKEVNASSPAYEQMGIYMDEIGMSWIHDSHNQIIWHNGGTGSYNSYLGVSTEKDTAVVILSNLPPDHRIPATVLGVKLLEELSR